MSPPDTPTDDVANKNIFRDTYLRYLGYANEVGESFRYQFPRLVKPSYGVAFAYVGADAMYCAYRHSEKNASLQDYNAESTKPVGDLHRVHAAIVGIDALTWQTLASVLLPGGAINLIVRSTRMALSRSSILLPNIVSTWIPTLIGLGSIPFIVSPIDNFVDFTMDQTARTYFYNYRP